MKSHLAFNDGTACGRGRVTTTHARQVSCLLCRDTSAFELAAETEATLRSEAFHAQTPREFSEPWHTPRTPMLCGSCGTRWFRIGDRTCYGHYDSYVCASCGHTESRLTETGMSF